METMNLTKKQVRELMTRSFKFGQNKYECDEFSIKIWIEDELNHELRKHE